MKTKKKPEQFQHKWKYCSLSNTLLREPIVCCELGKLYNKEAVIEYLSKNDSTTDQICGHIRNINDIITLNITAKSYLKEMDGDNEEEYVDIQDSKYICPFVVSEMNDKFKFCVLRKCGCVMSERALNEAKLDVCQFVVSKWMLRT